MLLLLLLLLLYMRPHDQNPLHDAHIFRIIVRRQLADQASILVAATHAGIAPNAISSKPYNKNVLVRSLPQHRQI